jgi:hypothetical protein
MENKNTIELTDEELEWLGKLLVHENFEIDIIRQRGDCIGKYLEATSVSRVIIESIINKILDNQDGK